MLSIKLGRGFEFTVEHGGAYLRIGGRDWYWSPAEGFVASRVEN
jgi:hypothetical protein